MNLIIKSLMWAGMNAHDAREAAEMLVDPARRDSAYVAAARAYIDGLAAGR